MKKSVGRQTGVSRRQAMQGGLNSLALATLFGAAARSLGADATTAPALADAVLRLMADAHVAARLAAAGQVTFNERFTADRMALEVLKVYRRAVEWRQSTRA